MKVFLLLFIFIPPFVFCQTSPVQSKSGESSLLLANNKTIIFNSSDASIGTNFSFNKAKNGKEKFWGFNLKLKSNDGIANLLEGYDFKPKFDYGLFKGGSIKSKKNSVSQWYYYGISGSNSYFNLLDSNAQYKFLEKNFFGWRIKTGYNRLGSIGNNSTLLGISLEYGKYNNIDDLNSVDKYNYVIDSTNYPNAIFLSSKKSGLKGNYLEENMIRVNFDYLFYPEFAKSRFAVGGYYRGGFKGGFQRQNIGIGIFLTQDEAPDKIVFGIVYQINDIFNQLKEEPNFQKRTGVSLTAGYNF